MPELDDWEYNEWSDSAQRAIDAETRQRRHEQSQPRHPPTLEFIELDKQQLLVSKKRAQDAWQTYRADISRQVEQSYAARQATEANEPDAEEREALAYWDERSRLVVLAYNFGFRQIYAMLRGKELFESGEGTLVSAKKEK